MFIGFTGFTLVMPFLPLYFAQLGVTDVGEIAIWSGISLGITPAVTALVAPAWGRLADRFGRKVMVARSLGSFVLVMSAMAYVTAAWHVFALRLVQGVFAGYGPLSLTMAADSSPPDRMAASIGTVQSAQRLGPAIGPVLGGAIAQVVGLRRAFLVSAAFYLLGLVLVLAFYREVRHQPAGQATPGPGPRDGVKAYAFRDVLRFDNFLLLMGVIFGLQFVDRSFGPILPLHLTAIGVPLDRVPVVSGLMFSLSAGAGALGNTLCAVWLRRVTTRTILRAASAAAAVAAVAFALVPRVSVLYLAAAVFGLAIGSGLTAAYTAGGAVIPPAARGAGFGVLSSAYLAALAISPVVAGVLGHSSIVAVFVVDALVLAIVGLAVARVMVISPTRTEAPAAEEI